MALTTHRRHYHRFRDVSTYQKIWRITCYGMKRNTFFMIQIKIKKNKNKKVIKHLNDKIYYDGNIR